MSSEVVSNSALRLDTGYQPLFQVPSRNLINVARLLTGNEGDFSVKYSVANLPKETAQNPEEFIKQQQAFVKDYTKSLRRFSDEQKAFIEGIRESADKAKENFDKLAHNKELTRFEKLMEFVDKTRANIPEAQIPKPKAPPLGGDDPAKANNPSKLIDSKPYTENNQIPNPLVPTNTSSGPSTQSKPSNAEQVFSERKEKLAAAQRQDNNPIFQTTDQRSTSTRTEKENPVQQRFDQGRTERIKALRDLEDKTSSTSDTSRTQRRLDEGRTERIKALRDLEDKTVKSEHTTDNDIEKRKEAIRAQEAKQAYAKAEQRQQNDEHDKFTEAPHETQQRRSA